MDAFNLVSLESFIVTASLTANLRLLMLLSI